MTSRKAVPEPIANAPSPSSSHVEALLDDALADTFPASDPVAIVCEDRAAAASDPTRQADAKGDKPAGAAS